MTAVLRRYGATTRRQFWQLRHDPRTLGIILVAPLVMLFLVHEIFRDDSAFATRVVTQMLAVFPVFLLFLLTAVAMVRERTSGTLERLLTTPLARGELLLAYATAYGLLGMIQVVVMVAFCVWVLDVDFAAPVGDVLLVSAATAALGVALGLLASAVSRSEFQSVQLSPVLVVPQILLCGMLGPRDQMADWLHALSDVLPLTYSIEALNELAEHGEPTAEYWQDLGVVAGVVVALLIIAAATLRRRTP